MAFPGTKVPPSHVPKEGAGTRRPLASGAKQIKVESLRIGQPSDVGQAPPSRVYTRDYTKVGRDKGDVDLITEALGNPLGL